jgi:hypothetical protein
MPISDRPTRLRDPEGYLRYNGVDDEGFFFLYGQKVFNTLHCREELAYDWDDDRPRCRQLGFIWNETIYIGRLARMWEHFERQMGLVEFTTFKRVNDPRGEAEIAKHIVLLSLSPFWVKSQCHRSVATLLLRLHIVYYEDKGQMTAAAWDRAFESYRLANECRKAFEWFLAGNTKFIYRTWIEEHDKWIDKWGDDDEDAPPEPRHPDDYGWGFVGAFNDLPMDDIKRKLVKP